jgi:hypothetical protein
MVESLQDDAHYLDVPAPASDLVRQPREDGPQAESAHQFGALQRQLRARNTARHDARAFFD